MNTLTAKLKNGLTIYHLKWIAAILMVLDHIHYFFGFTGKIPMWFTQLGRLSAPLFLFCLIEGYLHTHSQRRYFLKIYAISVVMGIIQILTMWGLGMRADGFYPQNQMLATFALCILCFYGIDCLREKKILKGLGILFAVLILPVLVTLFAAQQFPVAENQTFWLVFNFLAMTVLPVHNFIMDGGTIFIFVAIMMYLVRNRSLRIFVFIVVTLLIYGGVNFRLAGWNFDFWFNISYEWLSVFACLFMFCYNGQYGNKNQKMFYWFYPAHIYLLYGLSCMMLGFISLSL